MARFLLRRLLHLVLVLWFVTTLTFALLRLVPGGPFDRDRRLPPEVLANILAKYHLDEPVWRQYVRYLGSVIGGDLGPSYKYVDRGVNDVIAETLPVSAELGVLALAFVLTVSLPAGLAAARWRGSWIDRCVTLASATAIALPHFLLGALLIWIFALRLGWFQAGIWNEPGSAILPVATLGAAPAAYLAALLRSSLIETFRQDFIRTARAKGIGEAAIALKHALRNSLIPFLSVLGPLTATLLTGSFVVEYVFAIPGMGRFFITAVTDRDYPLIGGVTLVYTALLAAANLIVELCYGWLDPRIRTR
ncbi:MAG TPA: ABC transporter permease [candidate division Zixibacteria bacterium]|nr:ABC transporter permease [candidate division Zixibacteria bacterium]